MTFFYSIGDRKFYYIPGYLVNHLGGFGKLLFQIWKKKQTTNFKNTIKVSIVIGIL